MVKVYEKTKQTNKNFIWSLITQEMNRETTLRYCLTTDSEARQTKQKPLRVAVHTCGPSPREPEGELQVLDCLNQINKYNETNNIRNGDSYTIWCGNVTQYNRHENNIEIPQKPLCYFQVCMPKREMSLSTRYVIHMFIATLITANVGIN